MDQQTFSLIVRSIGRGGSRRAAVAALVVAALGGPVPGIVRADPAAESNIIPGCRLTGQRCRKKSNCCTGKCKNDRCACVNRGGSCLVTIARGLPPVPVHANCCSNRCDNAGKCR
ncbi:MAG: hypothetical protein ACKOWF_13480 [Chloroflexota bacterium]